MPQLRTAFFALLIAIGGSAAADTVRGPSGAIYGPSQDMKGVAVNGFEVDALTPCGDDREACIASAASTARAACWLEYTSEAREQLMLFSDDQAYEKVAYMRYWMELTGRHTVTKSQYGHLGAYPCQVLVENVTRYEELAGPGE